MPQLKFTINDFNQTSTWLGMLNPLPAYTTPTTKTDNKAVDISDILAGASIDSAILAVTCSSPYTGAAIRTVDGSPNFSVSKDFTAKLQALAGVYSTPISFQFKFKANGGQGSCSAAGTPHSSVLGWSDIELTVDYTFPYSACGAPTSASLSAAVSEGNVNLGFSGAEGGTSNAITGYEVEYAESDDNTSWGAWVALTSISSSSGSGSISVAPSSTRARYRKFRLRTQGAAGADYYSGWVETSSVRRNSAPAAPGITGPAASSTIYNSLPRVLATVGTDADGHSQTLALTNYAPSTTGNLAAGKKVVLLRTSAYVAGSKSISVTAVDTLGTASAAVARSFTCATPVYTDELAAGTTAIKAVHMNELRAMVDAVRAYYGLAAYAWAEAITAGSTSLAGWTEHVTELRAAIDAIVSLVNGWDTANNTNDITLPDWTAITENMPMAAIIQQIRDAIPLL